MVNKRFNVLEPIRMVWYPVDESCKDFLSLSLTTPNPSSTIPMNNTELAFFINGYGLQAGSTIDVSIITYYEMVASPQYQDLFADAAKTPDNKQGRFESIINFGKDNLSKLIMNGAQWAAAKAGKLGNSILGTLEGAGQSFLSKLGGEG